MIVTPLMLLLAVSNLSAQEQESKLVDRLLKPDVTLKNPAQDKQFVTSKAVSAEKRISVPRVSLRQKPPTKTFPDQRAFIAKESPARRFPAGDAVADVTPRSRPTKSDSVINPPGVTVQVAPESGTTSPTRDFAGSRPFLAEGKSQKALRTKNKPLTIEQVRELLNKSK
ncbi:MAG TPA: hypothetical protein VJU77_12700 [Chthoniobacterales bacterium]|nr:hypothetical protein [Chthoniobacterales bacterium]